MRRSKLDRIDKKILRDLQEDGRITNVDLAKRVGISAPPCLRRVRALEENGYIKSYHAKIDHAAMGYTVMIFALVKLNSQAEAVLDKFEAFAKAQPIIRECHLLAGDVDFFLKIVAKDWDNYQHFHKDVLTKAPGVESVKSSLAIRSGKDEVGVPIED
ncbi:MAG: Lrp/AsnC family transcriptional regulator [Alphaproteobacteria bacterium]|nr:Lrp/AsnC family transcriptional regulator [Alphaproteobacteria bacterium]